MGFCGEDFGDEGWEEETGVEGVFGEVGRVGGDGVEVGVELNYHN